MMRAVLALGAALGASLLIAGNASAQISQEGKSVTSSMYHFGGAEVWASLSNYGYCYAQNNRAKAMSLLATEPNSDEEAKIYTALFHAENQSCLGLVSELRVSHDRVRGAIAEGLYRRAVPPSPAIQFAALDPQAPIRSMTDFARCYVASHGDRVRSLVAATKPGSSQEHAAIAAMAPDFGPCLPTGLQVQINPITFRYILVEALYRTSPAAVVAGKN